jgi:hypothetical protein
MRSARRVPWIVSQPSPTTSAAATLGLVAMPENTSAVCATSSPTSAQPCWWVTEIASSPAISWAVRPEQTTDGSTSTWLRAPSVPLGRR